MDKDKSNRDTGRKPVTRDLPFFQELRSCGGRGGKALYKNAEGFYFQWDRLHRGWEKFSRTGRHLGGFESRWENSSEKRCKRQKDNHLRREKWISNL